MCVHGEANKQKVFYFLYKMSEEQQTSRLNGVSRVSKRKKSRPNCLESILLVLFVLIVFGLWMFFLFRTVFKQNQTSSQLTNTLSASVQADTNVSSLKPTNTQIEYRRGEFEQTEAYRNFSQILSHGMHHLNLTADPCNDFHEYVCGNWNKNFSRHFDNHWEMSMPKIYLIVYLALNQTKKTNSKAIQYVVDLYNEYGDEETRGKLGMQPLLQLLQQIFGHEQWPLLGNVSNSPPLLLSNFENRISKEFLQFWNSNDSSSIRAKLNFSDYSKFETFYKSWMLWEFSEKPISDERTDVNQWMDCFVEAALVGYHPLINMLTWEMSLIYQANEMILFPFDFAIEDMAELYEKFWSLKPVVSYLFELDYQNWNYTQNCALYEVLDFYRSFSRLFQNRKLSEPTMKTLTLGELKESYSSPQFDWTLLLNKYAARTGASLRYTDKDTVRVVVDQLALFRPFTELLTKTPIRVLKNAMALQTIEVSWVLNLLDAKRREVLVPQTPAEAILSDLPPGISFVMKHFDVFSPIFVRLYVDYVGRQKMLTARDQVIEMARHLKETFSESLKLEHAWLDEKTRQYALDKLEAMGIMIAFPDWILDDVVLDENLGFSKQTLNLPTNDSQTFIKGHFATSYLNFRRLKLGAEFRMNDQILHENRKFLFLRKYGFYHREQNFIGISFQILLEPWFNVDYPPAINYGNLGFIIAHEMMHAFENKGRLYDKHGEKVNWWTDSSSEHFEMLSKCFVTQYDGLVDPMTGLIINGTDTLGDNIADNGGLNQAYRAFEDGFKTYSQSTVFEVSPSFRVEFTPEQLFFISYSINWCPSYYNTAQMAEIFKKDTHVHSTNRFRVNIPLSNMAKFAKAFNCPVGSPMNPEHKCSIW